ncbi:MAG: Stp1/IreP family PP2C-type Ser/Thr phosphatase [Verrucomicrobia bacterium]|nr:Stp1/IreP family PP2C-type Ser/Thr phosphatase [Verrucomicrobiota bacterium]
MKIESYGATDIGLVRLNNEDVWAQMPREQLYILADGMGGHKAGEVAANETVMIICREIKTAAQRRHEIEQWREILTEAIQKANSHVHTLGTKDRNLSGMGTTLCVILIIGNTMLFAHVGDSRIYRIRKGRLLQMTHDHSLKEELLASGELDESLARNFPYKNVLTRAVGTQRQVTADFGTDHPEVGDIYFLCSDGLTDALPDPQIQDIIDASDTLEAAAAMLILEAKKNGGNDNITVLLLKII